MTYVVYCQGQDKQEGEYKDETEGSHQNCHAGFRFRR